jgi:hypothetical protein
MIPCDDFDRACNFYQTIIGRPLVKRDGINNTKMGFFIDPDKCTNCTNGGIIWGSAIKPGIHGSTVCLNADGVLNDYKKRVKKAGGKIVQEKISFGKYGSLIFFLDSEGNIVGLHTRPKRIPKKK